MTVKLGTYRAILVDCPTKFNAGTKGRPQHYPRMTDDQLKRLPIWTLAHPDGAWLFFWDTTPRIDITPTIARAWGFKRSSVAWYWSKTTKPQEGKPLAIKYGTGFTTRKSVEICHLFRIGTPKRISKAVGDMLITPAREHSRKPEEQYGMIETYCPGPYIELFARQRRRGWTTWGNEVDKFPTPTPK